MAGNSALGDSKIVVEKTSSGNPNYTTALIVLTSLFFMWGFITCMNDILIPYLKDVFTLTYFQAMLVQFAFFGAYFIGSLIYFAISASSGDPITKIGYKNGIIAGLLISGFSCALFYPAAELKIYGFFLSALFLLGIGFTLLQIAANPYVSILGTEETASSRLNLSQGFNSFGTTIAPLIGGFLVFEYFARDGELSADSVKIPYLVFAFTFFLLALLIKATNLPKFTSEDAGVKGAGALKYPHLIFGMFAIFCYVGGEVTIGSILINFFGLEEIMGLDKSEGDIFLAFYWGGAMIGRFLGAISLSKMADGAKKLGLMAIVSIASFGVIYFGAYFKSGFTLEFSTVTPFLIFVAINLLAFVFGKSIASRTLAVFAFVNIILLVITLSTDGKMAFWSVIGIGLFNSIMWSNIFTLAIEGLGKYKSQGSSLLVMAILGAALIPPIQGLLADSIGVHNSFIVPIFCYLYLVFYGIKGYKAGRKDMI
ncbi:sugar MFS transporter [Flexithrix dorotheae]|uniref:sugar MFS transporter n=1 Tax=Flexithrix dorotheae TaxID=70993 RepID=UPI00036005C9|nr:sugar MFS transporter [Flexithrix dorotheae]